MTKPPHVVICDGNEIARLGLAQALEAGGIETAGLAGDAATAAQLLEGAHVDVVLIDIALDGAEHLIRLSSSQGCRTIAMGIEADPEQALAALLAGAVGYLTKELPAQAWLDAIQGALRGEASLSRVMTARLIEAIRTRTLAPSLMQLLPSDRRLTAREWEILTRVAEGKTNRMVALELSISVETVRTHVSSILAKLQAPNRSAAAVKYHQLLSVV
jgi:DNA-binding NarL/FixJ family response regulator